MFLNFLRVIFEQVIVCTKYSNVTTKNFQKKPLRDFKQKGLAPWRNKLCLKQMINSFVYSFLHNQCIQPTHRGPGRLPFVALIDLGKEENLCGFKYYPEQNLWQPGIIRAYQFYVSTDNKEWKLVEFTQRRKTRRIQTGKAGLSYARFSLLSVDYQVYIRSYSVIHIGT